MGTAKGYSWDIFEREINFSISTVSTSRRPPNLTNRWTNSGRLVDLAWYRVKGDSPRSLDARRIDISLGSFIPLYFSLLIFIHYNLRNCWTIEVTKVETFPDMVNNNNKLFYVIFNAGILKPGSRGCGEKTFWEVLGRPFGGVNLGNQPRAKEKNGVRASYGWARYRPAGQLVPLLKVTGCRSREHRGMKKDGGGLVGRASEDFCRICG